MKSSLPQGPTPWKPSRQRPSCHQKDTIDAPISETETPPAISVLGKQGQEDGKFEVSLAYTTRLSQKAKMPKHQNKQQTKKRRLQSDHHTCHDEHLPAIANGDARANVTIPRVKASRVKLERNSVAGRLVQFPPCPRNHGSLL